MSTNGINKKYADLKRFIAEKGKDGVVIAFSGGVDSSTLAAICHEVLQEKAVAVIAKSPTYAAMEMVDAKAVAEEIGIKFYVIETDEMANENFSRNPENRCYYCKKELLTQLIGEARKLGLKAVFEGTNFSDLSEHRPGFQAVKECPNVYSPWVDNKFTKAEIRTVAKKLGLSAQNKPSRSCLASRIPYNEKITSEKLSRIEKAELKIKELTGVNQLRVRDHNGIARIEVGKDERDQLFSIKTFDKINSSLKQLGFKYVTIDLEGYKTGSMLLTLNKTNPSK